MLDVTWTRILDERNPSNELNIAETTFIAKKCIKKYALWYFRDHSADQDTH